MTLAANLSAFVGTAGVTSTGALSTTPVVNSATTLSLQTNNGTTGLYITASQNVGIGSTNPQYQLVVSNSGAAGVEISPTGGNNSGSFVQSYNRSTSAYFSHTNYASDWYWSNGTSTVLRVDANGNMGTGVLPSAWSGLNAGAIEIGAKGNGFVSNGSGNFIMLNNAYYNSGYKYATTAPATSYVQNAAGTHYWQVAASGAANGTIGFTQAMTLNNSGYLGISTTSPQSKLVVNTPFRDDSGTNSYVSGAIIAGPSSSSPSNSFGSGTSIFTVQASDQTNRLQFGVGLSAYSYAPWIQGSYDNATTVGGSGSGVTNIVLQPLGGNIGIGTTSPAVPIDINTSSTTTGLRLAFSGGQSLIMAAGSGGAGLWQIGNGSLNFGVNSNGSYTSPTGTVLTISNGGFVGISTTSPSYPLDVAGTTRVQADLYVGSSNGSNARYNFYDFNTGNNTGAAYLHMKTNQTMNNVMFAIRAEGYNYGQSASIDGWWVGYPYSPSNAVISGGVSNAGNMAFCNNTYKSSDGYLVLVGYFSSSYYYVGFSLSQVGAGPQGLYPLTVTATTFTSSNTGAY
jgi:hypothetical protein